MEKRGKRGQAEVVTTILLILIVLAAVIIVWQVVARFVQKGGEAIESKTACIDVRLDIVLANSSDTTIGATAVNGTVKVTRLTGGVDDAVSDIKILIKGEAATISSSPSPTTLTQFETKTWGTGNPNMANGDKVEVSPVLKDGTLCDPTASATAV